jgi:hypothetical protein
LDGYQTHIESNFHFDNYEKKYYLPVQLIPDSSVIGNSYPVIHSITVAPFRWGIRINAGVLNRNALIGIYSVDGTLITTLPISSSSIVEWNGEDTSNKYVSNGCYIVRIKDRDKEISKSFILNR